MAPRIWVVAEVGADGSLARISAEVATLARTLAEAAAGEAEGLVIAANPAAAAEELARYLPTVRAAEPLNDDRTWATAVAEILAGAADEKPPDLVLTGAGPDGRDVAGTLGALLGWPVLANAVSVTWVDGGPQVEQSVFGGKLTTTSAFTVGHGIITVRPNVIDAQPAANPGSVEAAAIEIDEPRLPRVVIRERIEEAGAAASIEEAKVIVAGGRGVGGEDGFRLVDELAELLGGAVGATRAAVDAGWVPYGQQIGQTGKIVKPQLYLALGVSGAIQHKVGMQTAATIVAINRDPDAPIAEFADMVVVGDLFEVGRALVEQLRSRRG